MPVCQNCKTQWSWGQTVKKSFILDSAMSCPFCGKKQYLTARSRKRSGALSMIIPFTILIPAFFNVSAGALAGIIIMLSLLLACVLPFLVELSSEQQALW